MKGDKDILSGASLEFFNQKPSFWVRYGSILIFGFLLLLALYYSSRGIEEPISSSLIQEAPMNAEEEAILLEESVNNIEVFTALGAQIEIGDTLFAFASEEILNTIQDFDSLLARDEITLNEKINAFKKISKELWPITLEQEVKDVYEALSTKTNIGISKASKARIEEMEAEVINAMKEAQSIRASLPKFEAMRDAAEKASKEGKDQYSAGSIELKEYQSLIKKRDETVSYVKIREQSLQESQRLITNFNRQIDAAKARAGRKVTDLNLVQSRFNDFENALRSWLDEVYVVASGSGKIVDLIASGPAKKGDLLYEVLDETSKQSADPILKANFSNKFDSEIVEGQEIILKVISDTFNKELYSTVKLKKPIGEDEFQIHINTPSGVDFESTFITEGYIIINKPKKSFLSKVWSNFT